MTKSPSPQSSTIRSRGLAGGVVILARGSGANRVRHGEILVEAAYAPFRLSFLAAGYWPDWPRHQRRAKTHGNKLRANCRRTFGHSAIEGDAKADQAHKPNKVTVKTAENSQEQQGLCDEIRKQKCVGLFYLRVAVLIIGPENLN